MLKIMLKIARNMLSVFEGLGRYSTLMADIFRSYSNWGKLIPSSIDQMIYIGVRSIPIVILTSFFTGMVSSVQAAYQMESTLTPKWFVGSLVGETVLLELAPVITALVLAGRIGATSFFIPNWLKENSLRAFIAFFP